MLPGGGMVRMACGSTCRSVVCANPLQCSFCTDIADAVVSRCRERLRAGELDPFTPLRVRAGAEAHETRTACSRIERQKRMDERFLPVRTIPDRLVHRNPKHREDLLTSVSDARHSGYGHAREISVMATSGNCSNQYF
jgi:hypothetical protein